MRSPHRGYVPLLLVAMLALSLSLPGWTTSASAQEAPGRGPDGTGAPGWSRDRGGDGEQADTDGERDEPASGDAGSDASSPVTPDDDDDDDAATDQAGGGPAVAEPSPSDTAVRPGTSGDSQNPPAPERREDSVSDRRSDTGTEGRRTLSDEVRSEPSPQTQGGADEPGSRGTAGMEATDGPVPRPGGGADSFPTGPTGDGEDAADRSHSVSRGAEASGPSEAQPDPTDGSTAEGAVSPDRPGRQTDERRGIGADTRADAGITAADRVQVGSAGGLTPPSPFDIGVLLLGLMAVAVLARTAGRSIAAKAGIVSRMRSGSRVALVGFALLPATVALALVAVTGSPSDTLAGGRGGSLVALAVVLTLAGAVWLTALLGGHSWLPAPLAQTAESRRAWIADVTSTVDEAASLARAGVGGVDALRSAAPENDADPVRRVLERGPAADRPPAGLKEFSLTALIDALAAAPDHAQAEDILLSGGTSLRQRYRAEFDRWVRSTQRQLVGALLLCVLPATAVIVAVIAAWVQIGI